MTKKAALAILIATLGLAACSQEPMTPSRIGGQSTAPDAQAGGSGGSVGAGNNSTHSNGTGGGMTGGSTGSGSGGGSGATGGGQ